jgi:hypothetical protein
MVTCQLCDKNIKQGKRVINGGVKYECASAEDLLECKRVQGARAMALEEEEQRQLSALGPSHRCKRCHKYVKSFSEIETQPVTIVCPLCEGTN